MIEGNFIVNVKSATSVNSIPIWINVKDDLIGSGSYTNLHKAEQHAQRLLELIKSYHNGELQLNGEKIEQTKKGRLEYLKANFKHLKTNDARVSRAESVLAYGVAVRVLSFTLPSVSFLGEVN